MGLLLQPAIKKVGLGGEVGSEDEVVFFQNFHNKMNNNL